MTKNNLDKHLSWLLKHSSSLIPSAEKTRLNVPVDNNQRNGGRGDGDVVVALTNQQLPTPAPTTLAQTTSVQSIFARSRNDMPTANMSAPQSGTTDGGMTTLQATKQSVASKHRMSSTTNTSTSVQTPSTSFLREGDVPSRAKGLKTTGHVMPAPPTLSTPGTSDKEMASTRTPINTKKPFLGIAAIDLTGGLDDDEFLTSPEHQQNPWFRAHEFSPRKSSTRPGHKRASTELTHDHQTKRTRNDSPSLPDTSIGTSTKNHALPTRSSSTMAPKRQVTEPMPSSEADEIFDNLTPSELFSDPDVVVEVPTIIGRSMQPSSGSSHPASTTLEPSITNDVSSMGLHTPPPIIPPLRQIPPPKESITLNKNTTVSLHSESIQSHRQTSFARREMDDFADRRSYAASTTSTPSLQLPLATKQALAAHTGKRAFSNSASHHTSTRQSGDDAAVKQFLQMTDDTMDGAISKLRSISLENSNKVFELTVDLNCENPAEMRTKLMDENKIISAKIAAIESLKMPRQAHMALSERQKTLKDKIVEVASRDPSLLEAGHELQEARALAKRIRDLEDQMLQTIKEAGLLGGFIASDRGFPGPDVNDDFDGAAILISGTPHPSTRKDTSRPAPAPASPTPLPTRPLFAREQSEHVSKKPRLSEETRVSPPLSEDIPDLAKEDEYEPLFPASFDDTFHRDHEFGETLEAPDSPGSIDPEEEDDLLEDLHRSNQSVAHSAALLKATPSRQPSAEVHRKPTAMPPPTAMTLQSSPMVCKTENRNAAPPGSISALQGHPWSKDVKAAMRDTFRLKGFRPHQLEAINTTLSGKDTFVLMPTGGGKSLCYQLPATIKSGKTSGVTIVVSPLLSLMDDQVAHLREWSIKAFVFNGDMPKEDKRYLLNLLQEKEVDEHIQLLYITPEMMDKSDAFADRVTALYNRNKLARIVIDEAHCVSQWGHDFRPDYKSLGSARHKWPKVPLMALTATATDNVKADVISNLNMQGCEVFAQSFNRPNLVYEIRPKGSKTDSVKSIAELINSSYNGKSGIVYCLARKRCEQVAKSLKSDFKIKASHYHAGMPSDQKTDVQKKWQDGRIKVIVATIAFGMGIDKPDVRFVIHEAIPKSLEGYYQETGRAGRDGLRAGCILFFSFGDTVLLRKMIDEGEGTREVKERQHDMLRMMINYCVNNVDCRRVQILSYFSERFSSEQCQQYCDICRSSATYELQDFTDYGQKALRLVQQSCRTSGMTLKNYEDAFKGTKQKKLEKLRGVPEYGAGASLDKMLITRLFQQLMIDGVLIEDMHAKNGMGFLLRYIIPGPTSQSFMRGRHKLMISVETAPVRATTKKAPSRKAKPGAHASPQSTNVSSPILPPGRGAKAVKRKQATRPNEGDEQAFGSLGNLEEAIVDEFLIRAREKCEEIAKEHNVKMPLFPDATLRAMATHFPIDETEMFSYPDADWEIVRRYGKYLLPLISNAKLHYDELKEMEAPVLDPNHQNVIDISSDDNGDSMEDFIADDDDVFDDYVEEEEPDDIDLETSPYFPPKNSSRTSSRSTNLQTYRYDNNTGSTSRRSGASTARRGRPSRRGGTAKSRRGASSGHSRTARSKSSAGRTPSGSRGGGSSKAKPSRTSTIPMMPT